MHVDAQVFNSFMISIVVIQGHESRMVLAINASGHPRIRWVDVGQILYGINGKSLDENQPNTLGST